MEGITQDGPQELAFLAFGIAQELEALGCGLLEHAGVDLVGLLAGWHVLCAVQIETHHIAPDLLEKSGLGLLAQIAHFQQFLEHGGCGKAAIERIRLQTERVLQRLDDVGHGVQTHHIRCAEGSAGCAAQLLAGQVIDHVVRQAEVLHLFHSGQHAGNTDAVGDEVGRVLGTHHTLAQVAGNKGFQIVQRLGQRGGRVDQFHQRHVARGVEEVDATEAGFDFFWQRFGQLGDGQARGVAGNDGVRRNKGRNLLVQVQFPVHALGNGLNDEVAFAQHGHVLFVVGLLNQHRVISHPQRSGLELFQAFNGLGNDAILGTLFGGQVKQHHGHLDIDQMGGDLRTHHAGTEHGDFIDLETGHCELSQNLNYCTRTQVCVRPMPNTEPRTSSFFPPSMGVRRKV